MGVGSAGAQGGGEGVGKIEERESKEKEAWYTSI